VVIAYLSPFCLILNHEDSWSCSLKEVNERSYDYVKLNKLAGRLDIGLKPPFHMLLGFDGSMVVPALKDFRDPQDAASCFNRVLGRLLMGGVFSEAVTVNDLQMGSLLPTGYVRVSSNSQSFSTELHTALRYSMGNPTQTMQLLNPRQHRVPELREAYNKGAAACDGLAEFLPSFLVNGYSHVRRRAWGEAVADLWIGIEQVTSHVWETRIIKDPRTAEVDFKERRDILHDSRVWTVAVILEILFQREVLDEATYRLLSRARRARNSLAHRGVLPAREHAFNALEGLLRLISLAKNPGNPEVYADLKDTLDRELEAESNRPRQYKTEEVIAWLPIPPLPGDKNWGEKPFEKVMVE